MGPEILWKCQKSINEIWTVSKLINKLPKNYNFNTRCTAKRCNSYFWCNFGVTCWWVWKLSKFHWYFLALFFKKSQAHLAQAHRELSKIKQFELSIERSSDQALAKALQEEPQHPVILGISTAETHLLSIAFFSKFGKQAYVYVGPPKKTFSFGIQIGIEIGIEVGMTWGSVKNSGEACVFCIVVIRGSSPPI